MYRLIETQVLLHMPFWSCFFFFLCYLYGLVQVTSQVFQHFLLGDFCVRKRFLSFLVWSPLELYTHLSLTLKVPRKILEQPTIYFCFLFFRGNNAWHYMSMHYNACLPSRQFSCNVKHYFLWKIWKTCFENVVCQLWLALKGLYNLLISIAVVNMMRCIILSLAPYRSVGSSIYKM